MIDKKILRGNIIFPITEGPYVRLFLSIKQVDLGRFMEAICGYERVTHYQLIKTSKCEVTIKDSWKFTTDSIHVRNDDSRYLLIVNLIAKTESIAEECREYLKNDRGCTESRTEVKFSRKGKEISYIPKEYFARGIYEAMES